MKEVTINSMDSILADCRELTEEEKRAVEEFGDERQRQFDEDPGRGLRPHVHPHPARAGWYCGNCKNYHSPDVHTCPEPPRGGSLRERLREARNG